MSGYLQTWSMRVMLCSEVGKYTYCYKIRLWIQNEQLIPLLSGKVPGNSCDNLIFKLFLVTCDLVSEYSFVRIWYTTDPCKALVSFGRWTILFSRSSDSSVSLYLITPSGVVVFLRKDISRWCATHRRNTNPSCRQKTHLKRKPDITVLSPMPDILMEAFMSVLKQLWISTKDVS